MQKGRTDGLEKEHHGLLAQSSGKFAMHTFAFSRKHTENIVRQMLNELCKTILLEKVSNNIELIRYLHNITAGVMNDVKMCRMQMKYREVVQRN